jgi:hypothetical protein
LCCDTLDFDSSCGLLILILIISGAGTKWLYFCANLPGTLEVKSLGPLAKGLLNGMPDAAAGPEAMGPVAKYPLVLAEDRTRRPDVLRHLKMYGGGWNITNKHYWAVCVVV